MHTKGKLKWLPNGLDHILYLDGNYFAEFEFALAKDDDPKIQAKYMRRLVKCWNEYDSLKAKADVCDELVEALKKYAGHLPACECMWKTLQSRKCTCGFEQALAKAESVNEDGICYG